MENKIKQKEQATVKLPKRKLVGVKVDNYLRYIIFLVLIGLVFIWNTHRAQDKAKKLEALEEARKKAKAEYNATLPRISYETMSSVVADKVAALGLKPASSPPQIIKRDNK